MKIRPDQWLTISIVSILLILSFVIRWQYINHTSMIKPIRADAREYTLIGLNLANYRAFTTDTGKEVESTPEYRDPGYPFFLAGIILVTNSFQQFLYVTLWTQALLGALTVVFTYFISRFFLPVPWSIGVAALTMLSPHLISMTNYILTETFFTFLLQGALLLFLIAMKKKNNLLFAASGSTFGMAMCVRTVLKLFPVGLILFFLLWYRKNNVITTKNIIVFLTASYILLGSWTAWSSVKFKDMEKPPSLLKIVLYEGSYVGVVYNDVPEGRPRYGVGMAHRDDPNFDNVVNKGYSGVFREIGKRFSNNPIKYSSWYLFGKPAMFWRWSLFHAGDINVYPSKYTWYDRSAPANLTKKSMRLFHPVIIILMHLFVVIYFLKLSHLLDDGHIPILTILLMMVYFLAIHVILVPAPRYSIPLRPQVYLLAVLAIYELFQRVNNRLSKSADKG